MKNCDGKTEIFIKKSKWSILLGIIAGAALLIGFAGCDSASGNNGNADYRMMETVFAKAQGLGCEGAIESFAERVKGASGKVGKDGMGA